MFPDAPTKRGIKHVEELIDAVKRHKAYIIFVVQMEKFHTLHPTKQYTKSLPMPL